jgi:hypothetical protein
MLPTDAYWVWAADADATPWYPTLHLYRCEKTGDWAPVMARVVAALNELQSPGDR